MMWIMRLVYFVALSSYSQRCHGNRLEEFLQEKQQYLREIASLFDTFYLNTTSHQRLGSTDAKAQRQILRSQPLPSPDWSTPAVSFDDVTEEDTDDYLDSSSFEDENYRPRLEGSGIEVRVDDLVENNPEDVFSGDSGLFLTGKLGDDDERYEDLGSGVSSTKTTPSRQTTSILKGTTTPVPVDADSDTAVDLECKNHLRAEMKSCIQFSLNVRTILQEMGNFVEQSGYYNGSSSYYIFQLFRTCASTIVSPPSCLELEAGKSVMDVVNNIVAALSHRNDDGANSEHGHFDCFHTHLQFLQFCLNSRLTNEQLETLVRIVLVRAKDASALECQDLQDVQQCVVGSLTKCDDSTSVRLVEEMFEATKRVMITCAVNTTTSGNSAVVSLSLGSIVTLALSVLALGLHKQIYN